MGDKAITLDEMDAMVGIAPPTPLKPMKLQAPEEPNPIQDDLPQLSGLRNKFEQAGKIYGIPVEILAGIASRESRAGKHLNALGYDKTKKSFGVMQINERYHKRRGKKPDDQAHINQAAEILSKNKKEIDKKFPKWTEEQRMQAAVAAYNFGVSNVKTWKGLDQGTTGNDYSTDVMSRARAYKSLTGTNQ